VKRGTFPVKQRNRWDRALKLEASGGGMVGHAGAVLLHRTADRIDLVGRLRGMLRASPWLLDRADVLVSLVVGIGLGAVNLAQAELLARHHAAVLGGQASDSTLWRTLEEIDAKTREKIGKARALVRVRVWALLEEREAGFPWITLLGKQPVGWVVIDMDATVITAASNKEQAAGTFKKTFGHHPPAAWCGNTLECLAMMLRPGNAGSNTASEHAGVLNEALRQVPSRFRRKILVRLDGAGASHEFIEHLTHLSARRRTVYFTSGFPITDADENAIRQLPAKAWGPAFDQDGTVDEHAQVAELTGISPRTGWGQVRFIVRRVRPSRRHAKKLTEYEKKVGWRFQLIVTNIPARGIRGVPGSHHAFFLDALQRQHAVVEDRVRTEKATGIRNLPFKSYARNQAWMLAANIASDLLAYLQLLGLDQDEHLATAEPETLRATILHIPARLTAHARRRILKIERSWPWAEAVVAAWDRLGAIPAPS
jgi:hypothetical protein